MSEWKYNMSLLNKLLEKNNWPRLKILTDEEGNVVYLNIFRKTAYSFLEFCDYDDIILLYNRLIIHNNINYPVIDMKDKKNISTVRYNILDYIIRTIPTKI